MAISDWSTTADLNTFVGSVNIAENCPAGNVNNAEREMMAQIRASFSSFVLGMLTSADAAAFRTGIGAAAISDIVSSVPVGSIFHLATTTLPTGYLRCDGSAVSRTTYAALFAALATTFGAGDGSTTFNLPDLRGEFVRGYDNGRGVDTSRVFGSAQSDDFKSHTHQVVEGAIPGGGYQYTSGDDMTNSIATYSATSATGGTETRPRNIALLAVIKF